MVIYKDLKNWDQKIICFQSSKIWYEFGLKRKFLTNMGLKTWFNDIGLTKFAVNNLEVRKSYKIKGPLRNHSMVICLFRENLVYFSSFLYLKLRKAPSKIRDHFSSFADPLLKRFEIFNLWRTERLRLWDAHVWRKCSVHPKTSSVRIVEKWLHLSM